MSAARIAELQGKLAARTGRDGPKPGYKRNVRALRAEIARLQHKVSSDVQR